MAAGLAAVATILVVLALSRRWWPVGDQAIIVSEINDVGGTTPLVGSFSRFGWRHPGPWMYWLLALPYRLGGGTPNAVNVGVAFVQIGAASATCRVAWRRGGVRLLAVAGAALMLMLRSLGPALLVDPWNPWVPILPFVLFLFFAWDTACGRRWSVVPTVALGSFVAQCHVGYLAPAVVIGLWSVVALLVWSRDRDAAPWAFVAPAGVAALFVAWIGPVWEQFTRPDGNVGLLANFFLHGQVAPGAGAEPGVPVGVSAAASLLSREVMGVPWAGGAEPPSFFSIEGLPPLFLLVPVALLLLVAVVGFRADRPDRVLGAATALVGLGAAGLSLSRVSGGTPDWIVRFTWPIALFATVMVVWGLVEWVVSWSTRTSFIVEPIVVGVALAVSVLSIGQIGVGARSAALPGDGSAEGMAAIADPVAAWIAGRGLGSVTVSPLGGGGGEDAGLLLELHRRGIDARAGAFFAPAWPSHRRAGTTDASLVVVGGEKAIDEVAARPDHELIVRSPGTDGAVAVFALPAPAPAPTAGG